MIYKLTPAILCDWQQKKELFTLIDVREQDEFDDGHIEGAVLVPQWIIEKKIQDVESNKDARVVVYCRSGGRSTMAAHALDQLGYTDVWNLQGGYLGYCDETE